MVSRRDELSLYLSNKFRHYVNAAILRNCFDFSFAGRWFHRDIIKDTFSFSSALFLSVSSLFAAQIARYYRFKKKINSLKTALNKKAGKIKTVSKLITEEPLSLFEGLGLFPDFDHYVTRNSSSRSFSIALCLFMMSVFDIEFARKYNFIFLYVNNNLKRINIVG